MTTRPRKAKQRALTAYVFTDGGILVERHALAGVSVLSEADLREQGLDGLRVAGDQNWRASGKVDA